MTDDIKPTAVLDIDVRALLADPAMFQFFVKHVQAFKFNALPDSITDEHDRYLFDVTVEQRGHGRWAICRQGEVFGRDYEWGWEPQSSSRDEKFLAEYRYDLVEAIPIALEAAKRIRINGHGVDTWRG